jgi:proton glutamate symport protein
MSGSPRLRPSLGVWSLVGLAAGTLMGLLGQVLGLPAIWTLSNTIEPLGTLWINALQMTVIPLVLTQLLAAIVRPEAGPSIGKLGGKAVLLFNAMLLGAGLVTLLVTDRFMAFYAFSPELVDALRTVAIPEAARVAAEAGSPPMREWLTGLVPGNPFEAAARGDILQLLVFTVLLGAAMARLPEDRRMPLVGLFRSLADAMMILVIWVLWGTPVGVFALMLDLSVETGLGALEVVGVYVVFICVVLVLVTALLYPLTVLLGRTSLKAFAKGALPAQIVAVGTQSSVAALPALIEGGKDELDLPPEATGFVLPLCVSTFKLNVTVSEPLTFLFMAHVFGVPLGFPELATFVLGSLLISFGSPGIPRGGGGFKTLPIWVMLGVPIQGIVIKEAVKTIPDVFFTLLNVTGNLSVATLLSRGDRRKRTGRPTGERAGRDGR